MTVFIGLSAVALNFGTEAPTETLFPSSNQRLLLTAIIFSAGGTGVVYSTLGKRSGGHINPAVTFAFWLMKKISTWDAVFYVAAQAAGALSGAYLVKILWGVWAQSTGLGATFPGPGVSQPAAFLAEALMTFALIFTILSVLSHPTLSKYTGLAAGVLVVLLVYFGAAISGTGINPARSLAPALLTHSFGSLWLYIAGPLLGAALAVWVLRGAGPLQICAKIYHSMDVRCIFCGHTPGLVAPKPAEASAKVGEGG